MTENLTRAYQKIFAKNAGAQGKTVFGSTAQGNTQYTTDISAMQSEAYENGFADAVVSKKAPVLQDFNTIENITTTQLAYLFQKGIPEWNSETTYFKGNIVLNIESDIPVLYYSLIDNNLNNQVSNTESWKKVPLDINIDSKANTNLNNLNTILISIATDLNAITTPGNYEFQPAIHTNTPFPVGIQTSFGMFVNVNPSNNNILQYVWSYGNDFFYRSYSSTTATWTAWMQVANTNLNNLSAVGKETIDYIAGPSNRNLQLSLQAPNTKYTAPGNGWVYFYCAYQSGDNVFVDGYNFNNGLGFHHFFSSNKSNDVCRGFIPCKKGDPFIISYYNDTIKNVDFRFIYAEGSY